MDKSKDNKHDQVNIETIGNYDFSDDDEDNGQFLSIFGVKISYQLVNVGIWIGLDIRKHYKLEI